MAMSMQDMLDKIMRGNAKTARLASEGSAWEALVGFYHAVNWGERNLLIYYALLLAYVVAVVRARKSANAQLALFLVTCGGVWAAGAGNRFFALRWRALGWTQNYFDKNGVFVASVYCAPLLLLAFAQLLYSLREAVGLMVKVKRADLKRKYKEGLAADKADAAARVKAE